MNVLNNFLSAMRVGSLSLAIAAVSGASAHAIDIKQVQSDTGVKALLVEDYTLPIIAMSFAFKGGATQDKAGKEGTLRMMTVLMDEGAGELDNTDFQSRVEELGISIGFSASGDEFSGSLRTLRGDLDESKELLRLAINEPRFDDDAIERMRDGLLRNLERSELDPGFQARRAFRQTLFGDHPYARNVSGTIESIGAISRDDIVAMNKKILSRDRLIVGVVGAISEAELKTMLDEVFGGLSEKTEIKAIPDIKPKLGEEVILDMPSPNASIRLVYKGIERSDPDFFAAHLMNHVLGGGSFASRLYEEIREKRGLAYSVGSGLSTFDHSELFVASTSTRAENGDKAIKIIRDEIKRIAEEGITQEELDIAKRYVAGAYAIGNLDTSGKIARVLVALQSEDLGIDYIETRAGQIEAVTLEDANRMAKELLSVEPTIIVVRPPATQ